MSELVIEDGGPDKTPTLVWWSTVGSERGFPWKVRHHDGTVSEAKAVRITGTVDFLKLTEGQTKELPDGPRGVAVLIEGTLVAGK